MSRDVTKEEFLKDVAKHQVNILHDDGVYRHIRFAAPGTRCMSFDLVTWPGYLSYSGDMGDFTFSRLNDMFDFFSSKGDELSINVSYWSSKLQSTDKNGGHKEFSAEDLMSQVKETLADAVEYGQLTVEESKTIASELAGDIEDSMGATLAYKCLYDYDNPDIDYTFEDVFDYSFTVPSYRIVWACWAIAWGIKEYKKTKGGAA